MIKRYTNLRLLLFFFHGTETVGVANIVRRTLRLLPNPNVLVAIRKGMQAVKLYANNITQRVPANTA